MAKKEETYRFPAGFNLQKRRGQDSNLRASFAGYTLSRRASSTTRAPLLQRVTNSLVFHLLVICKYFPFHLRLQNYKEKSE